MIELVGIALLVAAIGAVIVAVERARTLAVLRFEAGRVVVARGRVAPRVLAEVRDVAARNRLGRGQVTLRREGGALSVELREVGDPRAAQQLRNVLGRFRLAEVRG